MYIHILGTWVGFALPARVLDLAIGSVSLI